MQLSRVQLSEKTALQFAKLQQTYGGKSFQRTFDEALNACWYMVTQGSQPVKLIVPEEQPQMYDTVYNFDLSTTQYERQFIEIKRRLALSGRATNLDTIAYIIDKVYKYHLQDDLVLA